MQKLRRRRTIKKRRNSLGEVLDRKHSVKAGCFFGKRKCTLNFSRVRGVILFTEEYFYDLSDLNCSFKVENLAFYAAFQESIDIEVVLIISPYQSKHESVMMMELNQATTREA